jgi:hypothetical protein
MWCQHLRQRFPAECASTSVARRVVVSKNGIGSSRLRSRVRCRSIACWNSDEAPIGNARSPNFIASETPCFVGRAIAVLAADPRVIEKSGGL